MQLLECCTKYVMPHVQNQYTARPSSWMCHMVCVHGTASRCLPITPGLRGMYAAHLPRHLEHAYST